MQDQPSRFRRAWSAIRPWGRSAVTTKAAWPLAAAAVVGAIIGLWFLLDWRIDPATGAERREVITLLAQIVGGIVLTIGVGVTWRRMTFTEQTLRVTEQGQITERYTRAIEHLGHEKPAVRMGAIYALERLAKDSARDHWTVIEVLSAYIRDRTPIDPVAVDDERERPATDIQAALTVIGRRDITNEELGAVDLSNTRLTGADLSGAELSRAKLREANLSGAKLIRANLSEANLRVADFRGASLSGTLLSEARGLSQASLDEAIVDASTKVPKGLRSPP